MLWRDFVKTKEVQGNDKREFPVHSTLYVPRGSSQEDQVLNLCQGQDATPLWSVTAASIVRFNTAAFTTCEPP